MTASDVLLAQSESEPRRHRGCGDDRAAASRAALSARSCSPGREQGQPGAYSLDVVATEATLRLKLDPAFSVTGQVGERQVKADDDGASVRALHLALRRRGPRRTTRRPSSARRPTPSGTLATALAGERSLLDGGRVVELSELLGALTVRAEAGEPTRRELARARCPPPAVQRRVSRPPGRLEPATRR